MSWSVGVDEKHRRHIGYGVPSRCDQPGCEKRINRGLSHRCGGDVLSSDSPYGCGLYFCAEHGGGSACGRCKIGGDEFQPSADLAEWVEHVLTDSSWDQFRRHESEWAQAYRNRMSQINEGRA